LLAKKCSLQDTIPKIAGSANYAEPPLRKPMDFRRKNIRLHPTRYRGRGRYFITICCEGRRCIFSEPKQAEAIIDQFEIASGKYKFAANAYCVMPDHFHALVDGFGQDSDLLLFVRGFKQVTTRAFSGGTGISLWQKKFYDHILRTEDSPEAVAWYIWMNPVRKGFCSEPDEYPYSGSLTMDWKKSVHPIEIWTPAWKQTQVARP
jgi:putative transposase